MKKIIKNSYHLMFTFFCVITYNTYELYSYFENRDSGIYEYIDDMLTEICSSNGGGFSSDKIVQQIYATVVEQVFDQNEWLDLYISEQDFYAPNVICEGDGNSYRKHYHDKLCLLFDEYLKSKNPDVKIVAVEPAGSPVLSQGRPGPHKIQGIGAGFIPETLNTEIYDEIIAVENEDAFKTGRVLAKKEGLLVGISSGVSVYAATELAKRSDNKGKIIVALLPDTGERYLSTAKFVE